MTAEGLLAGQSCLISPVNAMSYCSLKPAPPLQLHATTLVLATIVSPLRIKSHKCEYPCFKTLPRSPITLEMKSMIAFRVSEATWDWFPVSLSSHCCNHIPSSFSLLQPHFLPVSGTCPAISTSEPLHFLFLLPEMLFPAMT